MKLRPAPFFIEKELKKKVSLLVDSLNRVSMVFGQPKCIFFFLVYDLNSLVYFYGHSHFIKYWEITGSLFHVMYILEYI